MRYLIPVILLLWPIPGLGYEQSGMASWYGPWHHGRLMANGQPFDRHANTAAHRTIALGSWIQVTDMHSGHSLLLRVTDRGPYHGNRILDVSQGAARRLGFELRGVSLVHLRVVALPPAN